MTLHLSLIRCWVQTHSALIGRSGGTSSASHPQPSQIHSWGNTLLRELSVLSQRFQVDMHARTPGFVVALWGNSGCSCNSVSRRIRTVTADIRQMHTWALGSSITPDQPPFALCIQKGDLSTSEWLSRSPDYRLDGSCCLKRARRTCFAKKHLSVLSFPEEVDRRLVSCRSFVNGMLKHINSR